jgi:hypothetical protein
MQPIGSAKHVVEHVISKGAKRSKTKPPNEVTIPQVTATIEVLKGE